MYFVSKPAGRRLPSSSVPRTNGYSSLDTTIPFILIHNLSHWAVYANKCLLCHYNDETTVANQWQQSLFQLSFETSNIDKATTSRSMFYTNWKEPKLSGVTTIVYRNGLTLVEKKRTEIRILIIIDKSKTRSVVSWHIIGEKRPEHLHITLILVSIAVSFSVSRCINTNLS